MAVRLEKAVKRFIGLSTDVKPVVGEWFESLGTGQPGSYLTAADLPDGSTFLETDVCLPDGSFRIARWDGAKWVYPSPDASLVRLTEALESLRREVAAMRLGMIDAGNCREVNANDLNLV